MRRLPAGKWLMAWALGAVALGCVAPAATAGTWTVVMGCHQATRGSSADDFGWIGSFSSRLDKVEQCQGPWNLADVDPANDWFRVWRNGLSWSGVPAGDRSAGWNFLVPGHAFYKGQLAGIAQHPTPDAPFSGIARVVRIRFDAGPGAPAGQLMRRNGLATYRVGLFSNAFVYAGGVPGVAAEPSGVARVRGCEENKTIGASTWPGQPAPTATRR